MGLVTRIVRIGNSQGIRIPKPLLEQAGLGECVDLMVEQGQITIRPASRPRQGWEEQFRAMAESRDDCLLDEPVVALSQFDEEEWEW